MDRLVRNGHRSIALATAPKDLNFGYAFLDAYKAALRRHRIGFDPDLVFREDLNEAGGYRVAETLLSRKHAPRRSC